MDASSRLKFPSTETDLPGWQRREDEETELSGRAVPLAELFRECRPGGGAMPEVTGYRILKYAGRGGEAVVWQAVRNADCREVALKVPHNAEECSERLLREGRILASMDHPGVMRMLGLAETSEGIPVLVLEWLQGTNLADLILPGGLPFEKVALLFGQILEAVEHAHSRGMVHRDLKPGNILIGYDGRPKVLDFGLAKKLIPGGGMSSMVTMSGCVAGTPEYLAPEGFEPGTRAGVVADVYALGIMLYELLTGQPPRGSWPRLSQVKRLDVRLDALMSEATATDPNRRLKSADAFQRRLHGILTSRQQYAGERLAKWPIRVLDIFWTAGGLYVAVAGYFSLRRLDGGDVPILFDLTAGRGQLLGGMRTSAVLCILLGALWSWQTVRLWIFRNVRMREALPGPLGIRPSRGFIAATAAGLAQIVCLWTGFFLMVAHFSKSNHWITERTPWWEKGLCVTASSDLKPVSAWTWYPARFFDDSAYVLREASWSGENGFLVSFQSLPFFIFTGPLAMAAGAGAIAAGMLATAVAAWLEWRQRHSVQSLMPLFLLTAGAGYMAAEYRCAAKARAEAVQDASCGMRARSQALITKNKTDWETLVRAAFGREFSEERIPELVAKLFAPQMHMGEQLWDRDQLLRQLLQWRRESYLKGQTVENFAVASNPEDFGQIYLTFDHFCDHDQNDKISGMLDGIHVVLKWRGNLSGAEETFRFDNWDFESKVLYCEMPPAHLPGTGNPEFMAWLKQFPMELGKAGLPDVEGFLARKMLARTAERSGGTRWINRTEMMPSLLRATGGMGRLRFEPVGDPLLRALPGGRWEVKWKVLQREKLEKADSHGLLSLDMDWRLEILPHGNSWRIFRLEGL